MKNWAEMWDLDDIEATWDAHEIVVTNGRIAFSWEEDGDLFHATLRSVDGTRYEGTYTCQGVVESQTREIELTRVSVQGTIFLLGHVVEDRTSGPVLLRVNEGDYDSIEG